MRRTSRSPTRSTACSTVPAGPGPASSYRRTSRTSASSNAAAYSSSASPAWPSNIRNGDTVTPMGRIQAKFSAGRQRAGDGLQLQDRQHAAEADVLAGHHHQLEDLGVVVVLAQSFDVGVADRVMVDRHPFGEFDRGPLGGRVARVLAEVVLPGADRLVLGDRVGGQAGGGAGQAAVQLR